MLWRFNMRNETVFKLGHKIYVIIYKKYNILLNSTCSRKSSPYSLIKTTPKPLMIISSTPPLRMEISLSAHSWKTRTIPHPIRLPAHNKRRTKRMTVTQSPSLRKSHEEGALLWRALVLRRTPTLALVTKVMHAFNLGYDEPFISKFKYYLSSNKINFDNIKKGIRPQPTIRHLFDQYPIYLKHTLFFNGEDYKKVRTF